MLYEDNSIHKLTGLDFSNLAFRFRRNKNSRSVRYYLKKVMNARRQKNKYKDK